jgi:hypothetical protein
MKISDQTVIRVFSGVVIVSDLLFSSFVFFCGTVFFVFEGAVARYFLLAGLMGLIVGVGYFYALGVLAKRMSIVDDLLEDKTLKKFCLFCKILRIA